MDLDVPGLRFNFGFVDIREKGASLLRQDNEVAIQAAIDVQATRGGGRVVVPVGTWNISGFVYLKTGVWLEGGSRLGSVIRIAPGQTGGIKTYGFDPLAAQCNATPGACSSAGEWSFGVRNLQLDGNKNNGAVGDGLSFYGSSFGIESVLIRDFSGWGLISMYTSANSYGPPGIPEGVSLEAHVRELVVMDCGTGQIDWAGPHDSLLSNLVVVSQSTNQMPDAMRIRDNGSGIQISHSHFWGGDPDCQVRVSTGSVHLVDCQIEGARETQVYLDGAAGTRIVGGKLFGQSPATPNQRGVVFDNARNSYIFSTFANLHGGAVDFLGDSGNNIIYAIVGLQDGDPLYVGVPNQHTIRHFVARRDLGGGLENLGEVMLNSATMNLGFFGTPPVSQQAVTGSRGGNGALASLIVALERYGIIVDASTP